MHASVTAALAAAALTALTWLATGTVIALARPRLPFGWLLLGGGVCLAAGGFLLGAGALAAAHRDLGLAAWLSWAGSVVFLPHLGANVAVYLLFPTGTLPSRRWRPWVLVTVAATALLVAAQAVNPDVSIDTTPLADLPNPAVHAGWAGGVLPAAVVAMNVAFGAGIAALWVRVRRSPSDRRIVRPVLVLALVSQAVGLLLVRPPGQWVYALAVPATACMTIAVAHGLVANRLWGVRETIGRAAAYLTLTAGIVLVFAAMLATAGAAFGGTKSARIAGIPLAALIVCLGLGPAQRRLQGAVDRVMYGRRHQPYAVLSELGAAMETSGDPSEALLRLVETTVSALRLPGAAVQLDGRTVAVHGDTGQGPAVRFPLVYQNTELGELIVAVRAGQAAFDPADLRLLTDLARQAGAAAHAVALTRQLRDSRERLVAVREAERRRLRRDLHDGVASALTAIGLTVDVAAATMPGDPDRAANLVRQVRADVAATLGEVRRVIDGLGPAALADLGLPGALSDLARRYDRNGLSIAATCDPGLPHLPAAAEVAAYRIAAEAVQNVAKHAAATHCRITVTAAADSRLHLEVTDNGRGRRAGAVPGVGIAGMTERAEEIGGTCTVTDHPAGGTVVRVLLPIQLEDGR